MEAKGLSVFLIPSSVLFIDINSHLVLVCSENILSEGWI